MFFCLLGALNTSMKIMNRVSQPFIRKFVVVYFNVILIYSHNEEGHVQHLKKSLKHQGRISYTET